MHAEKNHATEEKKRMEPKPTSPLFLWGKREAIDVIHDIDNAYETTTKWRKNVFKLPSGQTGKHFTQEIARLYTCYSDKSPQECIALKAAAIMVPLLLQQPAGKPSYNKNKGHLDRRLGLWKDGKFEDLLAAYKNN